MVYLYAESKEEEELPMRRAQDLWETVAKELPQAFFVVRELIGPYKLLYAEHYSTNDFKTLLDSPFVLNQTRKFNFGKFGMRL
jgi:hypothetical protein